MIGWWSNAIWIKFLWQTFHSSPVNVRYIWVWVQLLTYFSQLALLFFLQQYWTVCYHWIRVIRLYQPLKECTTIIMMLSSKETFSALLALCAGNSPVTGEFPSQRTVTQSFDVFYALNKRLSKQSWGWWFETPSPSLWRHCNDGGVYYDGRCNELVLELVMLLWLKN